MKQRATLLKIFLLGLLLLGPVSAVNAQLSKLDKGQLIEFMRAEGMRELLKHLVESEPMEDPVVKEQVLVSMLLLDYKDFRDSGDGEAAAESFNQAWERMRLLIQTHYIHPHRPMWQTQLAELLVFDYLQALNMNAAEFYEFGVTTKSQKAAFEKAVPEILELLEDADVRFFALQTELPKEADHVETRVNTGLWARMIKEYYQTRTRFALGRATYLATLLPAGHEYYKALGDNPKIVRQKKDAAGERVRLIKLANQSLEPLVNDPNDEWSIKTRCQGLLARVLAAQSKFTDAFDLYEKVLKTGNADMDELVAILGYAFGLDQKKRSSEAMVKLEEASAHSLARDALILKVLVVDAKHRLLLQSAQKQPADKRALAVAQAYQPYMDLLNDQDLGESAEALRGYIHKRWVDNVGPNANLADVPPVVVCAMGETMRVEGQNEAIEARNAGDLDALAAAKDKLKRAVKINADLRKRADITPSVAALAMFNQGMAVYFSDTADSPGIATAAKLFTELADAYPDQKVAETAISYAAEMLHQLHADGSPVAGVTEAYDKCVQVLLEKFPAIEATDNERFYYATTRLIPEQKIEEAVEVLAGIPASHITYYVAQRERLYGLFALYGENPEQAKSVASAARQLMESAQGAEADADSDQRPIIRNARGHAQLILSEIAALQGNIPQAIAYLNDFEQQYMTETELLRLGLGKRILLLARSGKYNDAANEAAKMMKSFPDDAAPVVDSVLTDLDERATLLRQQAAEELVERRKKQMLDNAKAMSETAAELARLLVDWAGGRDFSEEEMVPFKLILAKSKRAAGDAQAALTMLKPIFEKFDQDGDVISEYAEALYAVGGQANLVEAGELYKILISGLPPDEGGVYPSLYWNAWMRYLQVAEKTNSHTDIINARVRTLEASDPNLGGEPFASELRRLKNKFAR